MRLKEALPSEAAKRVFGKNYGMTAEMVEYYCQLGKLIWNCYQFAVKLRDEEKEESA